MLQQNFFIARTFYGTKSSLGPTSRHKTRDRMLGAPDQGERRRDLDIPGEVAGVAVKHLPIVKTAGEERGVSTVLKELVPSEMAVEPGVMVLALIVDTRAGSSPVDRCDALFETHATELVVGKPIAAKRVNDDPVGRFRDTLAATGTMKI